MEENNNNQTEPDTSAPEEEYIEITQDEKNKVRKNMTHIVTAMAGLTLLFASVSYLANTSWDDTVDTYNRTFNSATENLQHMTPEELKELPPGVNNTANDFKP